LCSIAAATEPERFRASIKTELTHVPSNAEGSCAAIKLTARRKAIEMAMRRVIMLIGLAVKS
jgi:polynucleotide 5'-kinase involved in rRNA processing